MARSARPLVTLVSFLLPLLSGCGAGHATASDTTPPPTPGADASSPAPPGPDADAGATGSGVDASPDAGDGAALPVVPAGGPVPPGRYAIRSVNSGKCLDLTGGGLDNGTVVVQETCTGGGTQAFDFLPVAAKYARIVNAASGRGLDVKDKSTAPGALVQEWTFQGGANQEFAAEAQGDGSFLLRARASGLPLGVTMASVADGAAVAQVTATGGPEQRWTFVPLAPLPAPGFVTVSGTDLLDGYGYYLLPRGVSVANWLEPEGYMWQLNGGNGDRPRRIEQRVTELLGDAAGKAFWTAYRSTYIAEDDIAKIAELGFNSIRLPMNARLLMPEGQSAFDEAEFQHVADIVSASRKHGIYVVLDMHCAPGGQTGTNIDDDPNDSPDLFTDTKNQDRLVALWTELARRYADDTTVMGYDLLNEPIAPSFSQYDGQLWPLYQRIGAAIRGVDAHHLLIVEGASWANDWSTLGAPFDPQLVYSFHKYWNANDVSAIQTYLDDRKAWNRPVWVGESGENSNDWYAASFSLLEQNGIGWAFWPWKKINGGNGPYDVNTPDNWSAFQSYVSSLSNPPSAAAAQAIFDSLLANAPLAKSSYDQAVVCAILPCQ